MEKDHIKGNTKKGDLKSKGKNRSEPSMSDDIHNVKPRDVSKNALHWENSDRIINATSRIFTKINFEKLSLHPFLTDLLQSPNDSVKKGFGLSSCTTVQAKSIPLNVQSQRNNVLMKSQTGSGKTLAYLTPMINDLMQINPPIQREEGTRALIIAPTRELCHQISDIISKLTQCCVKIVSGCISGGEKRKSEKARLRKGVVVLVSTPGRLLDHIKFTESFNLTNLRWIIMDEIDRLLDMGFEQTILEILSRIKGERLPGLKDEQLFSDKSNDNPATNGKNLVKKWSQQNLMLSKKVSQPEELRYLFASATLTKAVKQLAWPIMRSFNPSIGFAVVDGDHGTISTIRTEADLYEMNPEKAVIAPTGVISFEDEGENDNSGEASVAEKSGGTKALKVTLAENEQLDAPVRLAQYSMIIPCKWKLSALLSFLYLRRHQKVIVFFSTCDSVDYHALLFHLMKWPTNFQQQSFTPQTTAEGIDNQNQFTFTSFDDEVNWQERMQLLDEYNPGVEEVPVSTSGKNSKRKASSTTPSTSNNTNTTIDPLNWKFTGLFGEQCPMFRLHGKVPQSIRKLVYKEFSKASTGILLCTDVAARGLDLPKVDYILQYDPPCETSDYVHRIGRTARCGLAGSALLFLLPSEQLYLSLLASHGMQLTSLSLQSMFGEISKEIPGITPKRFRNYEEIASVVLQKASEACIARNKYLTFAGIQAYHSFLRAYTTHSSDTKGIFKLALLHLGHVAKSFGLKETPKEFKQQHKSTIINDVIGKIFNGEFSSKEFKQSLLPKKREKEEVPSTTTKMGKAKKDEKGEHNKKSKPTEVETASESEEVEVMEQIISDSEDEENDYENEELVKESRDEIPVSKASSLAKKESDSPSDVFVLGKRKLSFGANNSVNGKKRKMLSASGKFRAGGSYFRKKLRKQASSEFSAN